VGFCRMGRISRGLVTKRTQKKMYMEKGDHWVPRPCLVSYGATWTIGCVKGKSHLQILAMV